jgi:hypothetical protein
MNFATIYHGALVLLAQQAEEQFGGGKGAEKKKWVMDQLGAFLDQQRVPAFAKNLALFVAGLTIDFIVRKGLEQLGKS